MRIKNIEPLLKTKYIDLLATEYEDQKGNNKFWVWAQRPNNMRAICIAAIINNKLVVIKEFRIPLGDYEWGFPCGLLNKDEDPVEGAKREFKEETGLTVKKVLQVSPFIYHTPGLTDESISMVYVECEGEINKDGLEDSEDIETYLMTQEDVAKLLEDKDKKFGAKAWIVMNYFANHNNII